MIIEILGQIVDHIVIALLRARMKERVKGRRIERRRERKKKSRGWNEEQKESNRTTKNRGRVSTHFHSTPMSLILTENGN